MLDIHLSSMLILPSYRRKAGTMEPLRPGSFQLCFDPPVYEKPRQRKREVRVMLDNGVILTGITIHYPRGASERIKIPEELTMENRPEWLTQKVTLSQLYRDLLRLRIQEESRYRPDGA